MSIRINPIDRHCFEGCGSCHRCNKRGSSACPHPNTCSGRPDRELKREPHPDDLCFCTQGIMRWVTKDNRVIIRRYGSNPFYAEVKSDTKNQEDRDWHAYVEEKREVLDNESWDPIRFNDGTSVHDWTKKVYGG